jgi:hypothetical protein
MGLSIKTMPITILAKTNAILLKHLAPAPNQFITRPKITTEIKTTSPNIKTKNNINEPN